MTGEAYEFKDMNKLTSQNSLSEGRRKERGCYISTVKGFILVLLAILVAVVIGLIVHFAGSSKNIECNFQFPTDPKNPGGTGKQTASPPTANDPDIAECENLAAKGNSRICNACLGSVSSVTTTTASPSKPKVNDKVDVRLPTALVPKRYFVKIRPNMYGSDVTEFNFTGSVKILIECKKSTDNVTLHINQLNITEDSIKVYGNGANFSVSTERDTRRQFLILKLNKNLTVDGEYYVSMDFYGPLQDGLNGLYLSSYKRGNETIYLATTQFQATDARKAFPCFDEPAIKAQFDIILERKTSKIALSNMPIFRNQPLEDDWVADHFEPSPKMPTYLLAFIVCDFEFTQNVTKRNVTYRAWARPEAKNQTEYGLSIGVEVLTFFEDYFNITYPLPKQDMIALPDFSAGAMENWGLITYRETAMLYDPNESSEGNKQQVAIIIAHELAHQWFGDLVTPAWWDDIWLNEGFASYMEYFGVQQVEKDWQLDEQFVLGDLHSVFSFDGLISSHPLFVPVADPAEINEVFDSISYSKGASVIRMVKFFMGSDTFRNGLTNYLKALEYGAATHDDLWYAWGNQSAADGNVRTDVKEIMDTWILQMNYPVVNIKRTKNGMHVEQERFLLDRTAPDPGKYTSPFGYVWDIPFTYTHEDEQDFSATRINWMMGKNADFFSDALPEPGVDKWVLANIHQYGYYRVNYEEHNWKQLIRQLDEEHTVIPIINRAQILNDAWNLARAGLLNMEIALNTTNYLKHDREYVPWGAALTQLYFVDIMLQRHELYGKFSKFMADTVRDYFNEVTMDNTGATHMESYRRSQISSEACDYGIESCIDEAKLLYSQWMADEKTNPIDPGLRYTVYCTAIRHGGVDEWDFAYEQHKISNVAGELSKLRSAMSCSSQTWILYRYLQRAITPSEIRKQDAVSVIVSVSKNRVGRPLVWDFIRAQWPYLKQQYGDGSFSFSRLITGATSAFNSQFDVKQLEAFKVAYPDMGTGTRAFDQAIERTKSNIKWMEKNIDAIGNWLSTKNIA